ncbi:MAG: FlgO family outer membrane protein [Pseudomonadota bacterium]|nr:FlgO family outer membrane protein [Pseudomonadota bacterium]
MDSELGELRKNDSVTLKLEPTAMRLFMYLVEHADRVVSVEELLDRVWPNVVVSPDSVYAAIAALRRILGDDSKQPRYVANFVRRGYRLIAPISVWNDLDTDVKTRATASQLALLPVSGGSSMATQSAPPDSGIPDSSYTGALAVRLRMAAVVGLATLVIIAGGLAARNMRNKPAASVTVPALLAGASERSIAVLAFVDMSEKHDQEYFGDGMAEELIDQLSQLGELRVISRTSAFHFKARSDDARTIGAQLSVAHILEGSVRRSGDRLRVAIQLIDASDGSTRWSQSYERPADDVFTVQDDIAKDVVQALKGKLVVVPTQQQASTENIVAHNLLLEGRFFQERWAPGDSERAVASYQRALQIDPAYPNAWTELAWVTLWQAWYGDEKVQPADYDNARRAALKAIELRPDLALAHATRGWSETVLGLNWEVADSEFAKALELEPQNMRALYGKGMLARILRKNDESLRYYRAALDRDPINAFALQGFSSTLIAAGRTAEAVQSARKALEISPNIEAGHWYLGYAHLSNGELEAAHREIQLEPIEYLRFAGDALTAHARRDSRASDAALRSLLANTNPHKAYYLAAVYAATGDIKAAVAWLELARAAGTGLFAEASGDPAFNSIRNSPEFVSFLHRARLPTSVKRLD